MSLSSLPVEIHNKILFQLLLTGHEIINFAVLKLRPHFLACPLALACWCANRRLILRRAATARLAGEPSKDTAPPV
jgi:hypothetical protein